MEGHVAPDRNPGPGYDRLLLQLIPGDILSACPHRQFHTIPGLLHSRAALPNSYPNTPAFTRSTDDLETDLDHNLDCNLDRDHTGQNFSILII